MKSDYIFTSDRLGFRSWNDEDFNDFHAINSDEEVMKHFPTILSEDETRDFISRLQRHFEQYGYCYFAVETRHNQEFIGFVGLAYQTYETAFTPATDIGWRLKTSAWGKGYATEGAERCLEYAFNELNLDHIVSTCPLRNVASEKVMQKIGMKRQEEFLHPRLVDYPDYQPCVWYELRKSDWTSTNSSLK